LETEGQVGRGEPGDGAAQDASQLQCITIVDVDRHERALVEVDVEPGRRGEFVEDLFESSELTGTRQQHNERVVGVLNHRRRVLGPRRH
jgi:hypothetical protein